MSTQSDQPFIAILLAGAVYPSPLRRALDVPVLCLPIGEQGTLLDSWLRAFLETGRCQQLTIAVSSIDDANRINLEIESNPWASSLVRESLPVTVSVDKEKCRGSGGALLEHSHTLSSDDDACIFVAEASCVPPSGVRRMLSQLDDDTVGIVGGTASYEPAGLYVFRREAIATIPDFKYVDLKEQILPALYKQNLAVRQMIVCDRVLSLRTRRQYLEAHRALCECEADERVQRRLANVTIAKSARLSGTCLIGEGVTIEDGVVLHESIVLSGARCGEGSVIARSIVGDHAEISPRSMIKDEVINRSAAWRIAS